MSDYVYPFMVCLVNSSSRHHPRRMWTWRSPPGSSKSRISFGRFVHLVGFPVEVVPTQRGRESGHGRVPRASLLRILFSIRPCYFLWVYFFFFLFLLVGGGECTHESWRSVWVVSLQIGGNWRFPSSGENGCRRWLWVLTARLPSLLRGNSGEICKMAGFSVVRMWALYVLLQDLVNRVKAKAVAAGSISGLSDDLQELIEIAEDPSHPLLVLFTFKVNIHFIAIDIYQQKVLTSQNLPAKIRRKNENFGRFC